MLQNVATIVLQVEADYDLKIFGNLTQIVWMWSGEIIKEWIIIKRKGFFLKQNLV